MFNLTQQIQAKIFCTLMEQDNSQDSDFYDADRDVLDLAIA